MGLKNKKLKPGQENLINGEPTSEMRDEWEQTRMALMKQLNERIQFNIYGRLWLDDKIPDSNLTEAQYNFYMESIMKKTKKTENNAIDLFHSAVGERGGTTPPEELKCLYC